MGGGRAAEEQRVTELSKPHKAKILMQKMGLDGFYKDISAEEAAKQAANMRSQINLLRVTMLYERSIMEFKLGLPVWQECLEVAIEKFDLSGASPMDIVVMTKNHCSNDSALEGIAPRCCIFRSLFISFFFSLAFDWKYV